MVRQLILPMKHKITKTADIPNMIIRMSAMAMRIAFHHDSVLHSLAAGHDHKNIWDSLMFCQLLSPMRPDIANSAVFSP